MATLPLPPPTPIQASPAPIAMATTTAATTVSLVLSPRALTLWQVCRGCWGRCWVGVWGQGRSTVGWAKVPACCWCMFVTPPVQQGTFFSESTFHADSFMVLVQLPPPPLQVQSHALTSVHLLKIPCNGSRTTAWTHQNTHTLRQSSEIECGWPSGNGIENSHICNLFPEKWVCTASIKGEMQEKSGVCRVMCVCVLGVGWVRGYVWWWCRWDEVQCQFYILASPSCHQRPLWLVINVVFH